MLPSVEAVLASQLPGGINAVAVAAVREVLRVGVSAAGNTEAEEAVNVGLSALVTVLAGALLHSDVLLHTGGANHVEEKSKSEKNDNGSLEAVHCVTENRNEYRKLDAEIERAVDTLSTPELGQARDFDMPPEARNETLWAGLGVALCRIVHAIYLT